MEVDPIRLDELLKVLRTFEPKLDELTAALEKTVKDEVERQLRERDGSA